MLRLGLRQRRLWHIHRQLVLGRPMPNENCMRPVYVGRAKNLLGNRVKTILSIAQPSTLDSQLQPKRLPYGSLFISLKLILKKRWARSYKEIAGRFWKNFFLIIFGRLVSILNLLSLVFAVNAFFCARKKPIIAS